MVAWLLPEPMRLIPPLCPRAAGCARRCLLEAWGSLLPIIPVLAGPLTAAMLPPGEELSHPSTAWCVLGGSCMARASGDIDSLASSPDGDACILNLDAAGSLLVRRALMSSSA